MPPTLEKLKGHIAFDLSIRVCIRVCVRLCVRPCVRYTPLNVSPHFHLMLLLFQSSGMCVHSPSIIPVPVYPLCLVPHLSILGQVWYLIVSIPDLCTLTYFYDHYMHCTFLFEIYVPMKFGFDTSYIVFVLCFRNIMTDGRSGVRTKGLLPRSRHLHQRGRVFFFVNPVTKI